MNQQPNQQFKRYATAAIVLGGGGVLGAALLTGEQVAPANYGRAISYNGQRYYIQQDGRRTVYPNKDTCLRDVPAVRQQECEPVGDYKGGGGGWYGPVHSYYDKDTYNPDTRYPTEPADSSNVGKKLPMGASPHGFGENGKAHTDSGGS